MLEKLEEARKDAGLTRKQACEQMGVHYNTMKNWEKGETEPKATDLVTLAELYGTTVEALMGLDVSEAETA